MTRVSVIMPVYNVIDWIDEAVQSVLAQDHEDLELIVVDDGSTDPRAVELLSRDPWPGVRVIRRDNGGSGAARNTGIAAATGEYIMPVDCDDTIAPDYVSRAAKVLDDQPTTGIVYCRADLMGAQSGPWHLPPYSLPLMLTQGLIFTSALFRKADWEVAGGYDETLPFREDHDFWLKIVGLGREVHQIDDVLFHYRIRPGSRNTDLPREELVATYVRIIQNNAGLYAQYWPHLVPAWFDRTDELNDYHHRYARLERLINAHPRVYGALRTVKRRLARES